jgi:hypothetical protein
MNRTEKNKRMVELFLETKFKGCEIFIEKKNHDQSNGFFLHVKKYYLGDTQIIYQHTNPTEFKVCFNNSFLKELSRWIPVKGKKQFFRDWFFSKYLPNFEFKDKIKLY